MENQDFDKDQNYDDVFMRSVIVGLSSFLYDIIKIPQTVSGSTQLKKVKFFYSRSGSEQFLTDYFLNFDKYCNELTTKIEGNINTLPMGVFSVGTVGISTQDLAGGYNRSTYWKKFDTDFGPEMRQMSARGRFIPLNIEWDFKVKATSDGQRWKIFQSLIRRLYKVKKFYIKFEGFEIPCMISLPEDFEANKHMIFRSGEQERPQMEFGVSMLTFLPDMDETTERFNEERIEQFNSNVKTQ